MGVVHVCLPFDPQIPLSVLFYTGTVLSLFMQCMCLFYNLSLDRVNGLGRLTTANPTPTPLSATRLGLIIPLSKGPGPSDLAMLRSGGPKILAPPLPKTLFRRPRARKN